MRAESLLCREQVFVGHATAPYLRPGYIFDLDGHFRRDFNQSYLTIEVNHQGSQVAYLTAGLQKALSRMEKKQVYQNQFTAIPAPVQFRPDHKTPKPRFYGAMNARVDAAGSGRYGRTRRTRAIQGGFAL